MKKFLIIQTAFIGDVILATALVESLRANDANCRIDFAVRKGNESLLEGHPYIDKVHVWDKQNGKYKSLRKVGKAIQSESYDVVISLQRFASSGWLAYKSKAKQIIGFKNNPLSFLFHHKVPHEIGNHKHEIERNHDLVESIGSFPKRNPKLYPSKEDFAKVEGYKSVAYRVMAPSSVWFTKQLPESKWVELIQSSEQKVYLIGAPTDKDDLDQIISKASVSNCENLAGKLSLLQSAALMKDAEMNFVNDSAPLHLASAMDAKVTAFFCSTIPEFGFGPLSTNSTILQTSLDLDCRPCGLHGKSSCPKGHFKCGATIDVTIEVN